MSLLKLGQSAPAYLSVCQRQFSTLLTKNSLIHAPIDTSNNNENNDNSAATTNDLLLNTYNYNLTHKRLMYTFRLSNKIVRNTHATRPRKTNNNSTELTYEQAQFAEKIGLTKSWNSWNTSNVLDGKRQAENSFEDFTIRKFLYGTFHGILASEIIIKRRFNQVEIAFFVKLTRGFVPQKVYFLVGYAEELLSCLFKCVVKIEPQTIGNKRDLVFRNW